MSQTHPTLYTEQRGNQHSPFMQLQKPATVTQGTGFPTTEWKLHVSGYGRVLEQEIEGTEKSIYWTLWPNFEVQCSTGVLAQTFHKGLSLISLQAVLGSNMEQTGTGSGISNYLTGWVYTDVPDFNPNHK